MTPRSVLFSFAIVAASGLPALSCPGAEALAKGVIFETKDGTVETHRRFGQDMIVIQTEFSDGSGAILETQHGLYLASSTPVEDGVIRIGEKDVFASYAELAKWDAPKPDAQWQNDSAGGGTAKAGALGTFKLGTCAYPAFEVALTFNDDPTYTEVYQYLPEMGVGLLVASTTNGDEERYTYTEVRAVE